MNKPKRRKTGSKQLLKSAYYCDLLTKYENEETARGLRAPATIECEKILLRHFFAWLESAKCTTLLDVTLAKTSEFLTRFADTNPCSVSRMIGTLKKLYKFAVQNGVESANFVPALISRPSQRRKLRPTLTAEQANAVLSAVDTSKPLGKRDYAIMLIAKHLGVRAGDIVSLKLGDISWEKNELTFRQNKTNVGLTLPLPAVVGNAIAKYILDARPKTSDEHIFVRHFVPFEKLDGATNIFRRYDPDWKFERGTGFHSFRRSMASQLLNAGVEPDTVKGVLGQTQIDSLKPYVRISDARLRLCPLNLQGFETAQEELC